MANVAIIIGNVNYARNEDMLTCCAHDVSAMHELIETTAKYDKICALTDVTSAQFREAVLNALDKQTSIEEIFFYFTGHGHYDGSEFFHCASNFDPDRPNETGLSNTDLHTILKGANPEIVVKVIDACYSGSVLIKSQASIIPSESYFKNFIQFASSLSNQSSLTGDPLSVYTEKFISAALKKENGSVLYDDIKNTIRDDFRSNDLQTPYFTAAHTGRETFVDNASLLDGLRAKRSKIQEAQAATENLPATTAVQTPIEILQRAEESYASKEAAQAFVYRLTENLSAKAGTREFDQLFTSSVIKHSDFMEESTNKFMINVLSRENRRDNFVDVSLKNRNTRPLSIYEMASSFATYIVDYEDRYDITLNSSLENLQLKLTMTPKFVALNQFELVVTCAPSLEFCYVFELLTRHKLSDWGVYESAGKEVVKRWYKKKWSSSCDDLTEKIFMTLENKIRKSVDDTFESLASKR